MPGALALFSGPLINFSGPNPDFSAENMYIKYNSNNNKTTTIYGQRRISDNYYRKWIHVGQCLRVSGPRNGLESSIPAKILTFWGPGTLFLVFLGPRTAFGAFRLTSTTAYRHTYHCSIIIPVVDDAKIRPVGDLPCISHCFQFLLML